VFWIKEFRAGAEVPAEAYAPSPRPYRGLPEISYPLHDREVFVTACERICMHRKRVDISTVLAGQRVGIKEVDEGIWIVSFMHDDLGFIDLEQKTLQPRDNPFGPRLLPIGLHSSGETVGNRYTCRLIEFTIQINPFLQESLVAGEA